MQMRGNMGSIEYAVKTSDIKALESYNLCIEDLISLTRWALLHGQSQVLDWMTDRGLRSNHLVWEYILEVAIKSGHKSSLTWIMKMGVTVEKLKRYMEKVDINDIDTYEWFLCLVQPNNTVINNWILKHIKAENLTILQWLYQYNPSWFSPISDTKVHRVLLMLLEIRETDILDWLLSINYLSIDEIKSKTHLLYRSKLPMLKWLVAQGVIGLDQDFHLSEIFYNAVRNRNLEIIKWTDSCSYIHRQYVIFVYKHVIRAGELEMFKLLVSSSGIRYRTGMGTDAVLAVIGDDESILRYMYNHMGMLLQNCIHEELIYKAIRLNKATVVRWLLTIGCIIDLGKVQLEQAPTHEIISILREKGAKTMFFSSCPKVWKCKNAGLWQHLVYDGPIAEICKDKLLASEGLPALDSTAYAKWLYGRFEPVIPNKSQLSYNS